MPKRKWPLLLLVVLSLVVSEILVRIVAGDRLVLWETERNLLYDHHKDLGWFPRENSSSRFYGSVWFTARHNNRGFRDQDHGQKRKKRMVFLGDSFVWGYDVEAEDRFTDLLRDSFPDWEILNLGVSGYGTDQSFILLQEQFSYYQPDVVFYLYDFASDPLDNSRNRNYGGYYKPQFVPAGNQLQLSGIPVPKTYYYYAREHSLWFRSYLIRLACKVFIWARYPLNVVEDTELSSDILHAMRNFVNAQGIPFYLGFTELGSNGAEINFCRSFQMACVDLTTPLRFPAQGEHWTPEGHKVVRDKIVAFLHREGIR